GLRPGAGLLEESQLALGGSRARRPRAGDLRRRTARLPPRTRSVESMSVGRSDQNPSHPTPDALFGRSVRPAALALADGTIYRGRTFGAPAVRSGEVVVNTSITGYQEIATDPSYAGQIVVMTYTQIGNVGVNAADDESRRPFLSGFVVKE